MGLIVEGVEKSYGAHRVLKGASLTLPAGALHALLGPSGSGKSTLLRIVSGLASADAGEIRIAGQPVLGPGLSVPGRQRGVGIVFQDLGLWPHMTVLQHLQFVLGNDAARRCKELLDLSGLSGLEQRRPGELSGGERQRLALARALAPAPRLLLLDEPFKSLDEPEAARLAREVRDLVKRTQTTTLLVSHARLEALQLCDAIGFLSDGRVIHEGPPNSVFSSEAPEPVRRFFCDLNSRAAGEGQS